MDGLPVKTSPEVLTKLAHLVQEPLWQQRRWLDTERSGMPVATDEAWKYTSLKYFKAMQFKAAHKQSIENINYEGLSIQLDAYRLVFFDGHFCSRCSDWIPWARVAPIDTLSGIEANELSRALSQEAFAALTDATASAGMLIEVRDGVKFDRPLYLLHIETGGAGELASYRHHIELGTLSECEVIEHHISINSVSQQSGEQELHQGGVSLSRVTMHVNEGAHLKHTKLVEEAALQHHFGHNDICLQRDASAVSNVALLSGHIARHQTSSCLKGENSELEMNSVSLTSGDQTFDSRTFLRHQAPHCNSQQTHKVIARDQSNGVFDGMILVDKHAIKTNGQMDNHNLILSDEAQINSKPQLEIYADDVKCSHGATTGQLDKQQVEYMRARGISEVKAREMITFAFANEVAEKISNNQVGEYLSEKIKASLKQAHKAEKCNG